MKVINVDAFRKLIASHGRMTAIWTKNPPRLAALDVGKKNVGVAFTDDKMINALPYGVLQRDFPSMGVESLLKLSRKIQHIVTQHNVVGFVVGLPLTEDGELTPFCHDVIQLMSKMECYRIGRDVNFSKPADKADINYMEESMICTFWDERNSSVGARKLARTMTAKRSARNKYKDSLAASLILEGFLHCR